MAGHIAGIGYSVRVNSNGRPLAGWKIYVYETGTSTPVTTYSDYSLSLELPHPMEADANGMAPMFWVADGTYRVRGTDADGNELFDDDGIVALGPSSGTAASSSSVDSNSVAATGDFNWQPVAGTRTGWVRANARTIGSSASGGTERANSDCENLFLFLWNTFSNSLCPVTGGRGGSAAADWAANKVIATLDMRNRGGFGLDDMGNTAAGLAAGSTSAAAAIGATTFTIAQANLPNVSLSSTGLAGGLASKTITNGTDMVRATGSANADDAGSGFEVLSGSSVGATISVASSEVNIFGTVPLGGSGTAISLAPRARVGTWYIRL